MKTAAKLAVVSLLAGCRPAAPQAGTPSPHPGAGRFGAAATKDGAPRQLAFSSANVFWAHKYPGTATIDVVHFADEDPTGGLTAFEVGQQVTVVSRTGVGEAEVIEVATEGHPGEYHTYVTLDGGDEGLALLGIEPAPGARLQKLAEVDLTRPEHDAVWDATHKAFGAHVATEAKPLLAANPLKREHVVAVTGRFGGSGRVLVAATIPIGAPDSDDYISGLLVAGGGQAPSIIESPTITLEPYAPILRVDLDADGQDEFVYTSAYDEGTYRLFAFPDGAGYAKFMLGGHDGA